MEEHYMMRLRRGLDQLEPFDESDLLTSDETPVVDNLFRDGFVSSFTMILLAEIADKTFFIAAIMAMRYNKVIVFAGAYSALVIMTGLSCALGQVVGLIPQYITHYIAASLFAIFALQMIYEAYKMRGQSAQGEMEEVAAELREDDEELRVRFRKNSKSEEPGEGDIVVEITSEEKKDARARKENGEVNAESTLLGSKSSVNAVTKEETVEPKEEEKSVSCVKRIENFLAICINAVFLKAFILTFIAEWGDRSQLSTVTLATTTNMYAVFIGGCLGHFCCTLAAIIFGAAIAKKVSMTILNLCGGLLFLGFSGYTFYLAATNEND